MSDERAWGADTVTLGKRVGGEEERPERQRGRRMSRPKQPALAPRAILIGALALAALAVLVAVLGSGSEPRPAPTREVAEPAPRVAVKPPRRMRRGELHTPSKPRVRRKGAGKPEDEREPKASAKAHELDEPEPAPAPAPESAAEPAPGPAPAPAPTPPAAEFGM